MTTLKKIHKLSSYDYDAKSERKFCESIPTAIKWGLHQRVYKWTYSEMHSLGTKEVGKKYTKQYTPDINFITYDLELKGFLRPDAKRRMEVLRKLDPDADIRIAFQKNLPVSKKAKRKYLDWAKIHNFKACIAKTYDELPEDWKLEALEGESDDKS